VVNVVRRRKNRLAWLTKCRRGNSNDAQLNGVEEADWEQGGNWTIVDDAAVRFANQVKAVLKQ